MTRPPLDAQPVGAAPLSPDPPLALPGPDSLDPPVSRPFLSTGPQGHRGRMRERLLAAGSDGLADYEVLEMLLFFGIPRRDTKPLAKALINRFGSLAAVVSAPLDDLAATPGVGPDSVAALQLVRLAAARLAQAEAVSRPVLNDWQKLMAYVEEALAADPRAQIRLLFLDNRNRLLADEAHALASSGDVSGFSRTVMRRALELHATALILVQNQPGRAPEPRDADIAMTRRLRDAARVLSVTVHDHVLLGDGRWVSFKRLGLL